MIDPVSVRRASEAELTRVGARVNPDLAPIEPGNLSLRDGAQVARRVLAINALVRAAFGASRAVALRWLDRHGLVAALQPDEAAFLRRPGAMAEADRWLCLHVETLAMAAWLGGLARTDLLPWDPRPESTAAHFPDPQNDDSPRAFIAAFVLRPREEILRQLDLYRRAHWHARQCERDGTPDTPIPYASVQFRRLLLEWTCHVNVDWHDVDLGT